MPLTSLLSFRRTLLTLAFIVAAVSIAACGDDDDASPDESATPTSVPTTADGATPTPEATDEPDDGDTTPGPTLSDADSQLQSFLDTWLGGVNAKVTYDYVSNFGGKPDGVYTTYYLDGETRHDWFNEASGLEVTITTIATDDESYVCTISESNPFCELETAAQAMAIRVPFLIILQTANTVSDRIATLEVNALPDEDIAGVEASCYEAIASDERLTSGPPAVETVGYCFSEEGVLLRVDHAVVFAEDGAELPDGELLLEATSVEDPAAGDFDPPARVLGS